MQPGGQAPIGRAILLCSCLGDPSIISILALGCSLQNLVQREGSSGMLAGLWGRPGSFALHVRLLEGSAGKLLVLPSLHMTMR